MSFHLTRVSLRIVARRVLISLAATAVIAGFGGSILAQKDNKSQAQSGTNVQRMDVMRSKLEAMKRSLDSAVAAMPAPAKDSSDKTKNADDPRERLRGLSKEVNSVLSEVNDLHAKEDRSDKYDASKLDTL